MSLVPVDEQLVAEVLIRNEDVGFVREEQNVKIKLATFPFQKYGMIEGKVRRISADAADTQSKSEQSDEAMASVSPYKAIIALSTQSLSNRGSDWSLTPGMQVVAEIREGERTVMEYLLSPVQKAMNEAARER